MTTWIMNGVGDILLNLLLVASTYGLFMLGIFLFGP